MIPVEMGKDHPDVESSEDPYFSYRSDPLDLRQIEINAIRIVAAERIIGIHNLPSRGSFAENMAQMVVDKNFIPPDDFVHSLDFIMDDVHNIEEVISWWRKQEDMLEMTQRTQAALGEIPSVLLISQN